VIQYLTTFIALLLMFLLPGMTMLFFLYPRKGDLGGDADLTTRAALGACLSVVIYLIIVFILDYSSKNVDEGLITGRNLFLILGTISISFFILGWYRGAYPWLGKLHPSFSRYPIPLIQGIPLITDQNKLKELNELATKRKRLQKRIDELDDRIPLTRPPERGELIDKKKAKLNKLKEIDQRIEDLTYEEQ